MEILINIMADYYKYDSVILHPIPAYKSNEMEIHIGLTRRINPIGFSSFVLYFYEDKSQASGCDHFN